MENPNPPPLRPDEKGWGVFCHASLLLGLGVIVPALVYWRTSDRESPLGRHAREALNFQITIYLYSFLCALLIPAIIGLFLLFGVVVTGAVIGLIGTIRAWRGATVHYPFCMRYVLGKDHPFRQAKR